MSRLPTDPHPVTGHTMLADLTAIKAAFGPLAIRWIEIDGETLHGRESDRTGQAVPVPEYGR